MNRIAKRLAIFILCLWCAPLYSHTSGSSFLALRVSEPNIVTAHYDFDLRDLNQLLQLDRNLDGELTWGEIESAERSIETLVLAKTSLSVHGECTLQSREPLSLAEHGEGPFARVTFIFECPDAAAALQIDQSAWFRFDSGHRALLEYTSASGKSTQALLSQAVPRWHVAETTASRLRRFVVEGAIHLVTGYDHLAFLGILLLALARRRKSEPRTPLPIMLRRALAIITAFTVAHSFTLALAATGKLVLPTKPVEVTIAASVLLAAAFNLHRSAAHHGFKIAFIFGLVHGLGFAGALAELASGGVDLLSLAAFNLGIEAAQIAIAAATVPLVWILFRNSRSEAVGLPLASLCVAVLAGFWIVARISA